MSLCYQNFLESFLLPIQRLIVHNDLPLIHTDHFGDS